MTSARWSWDALLAIVRDTVLRAKLRAVEPDMLDKIPGRDHAAAGHRRRVLDIAGARYRSTSG